MDVRARARKLRSEVRQEQIVQAALEVVGKHGLRALTVSAIAADVGVVPSGIYRHYRGKKQIIDAVLGLIGERLQANLHAVRAESADAVERLRRLYCRHVELVRANMGIPRLVFAADVCDGDQDRKKRLYGVITAYLAGVASIVRQGQEEGTLISGIAPDAVALMFLGLIQPAAMLWQVSAGSFDVVAETEPCWHLFSNAIQAGKRPGDPGGSAESTADPSTPTIGHNQEPEGGTR